MTEKLAKGAPCGHDDCGGVRLSTTAWCLAHAAEQDPGAFDTELKRLGAGATLDARGVVISAELLGRLLAAVPHEDGQPVFNGAVNFNGASFQGEARFDGARFRGEARFSGATFQGEARFDGARFRGEARFSGATFQGEAHFDGARFQGAAWFGEAHFLREAGFREASFQDTARFGGARFQVVAGFRQASFQGSARFSWARFDGPAWFDDASFGGEARFWEAEFGHTAGFRGTNFADEAGFQRASFRHRAWFDDGDFQGEARFREVSFQRETLFRKARFQSPARFVKASFQSDAGFDDAVFLGKGEFDQACFQGKTGFGQAAFHGEAGFDAATFQRNAGFRAVRFLGEAGFRRTRFQGTGDFGEATFERTVQVGPLLARQLVLDGAVFAVRVQLEAAAAALCARRAQFPAGVHLRLRYASVVLDDARISTPAILAGAPFPFPGLNEPEKPWQRMPPGPHQERWRPRLLSVCRADLAGLRLADVDLRACRFVGTPNLNLLRIEGAPLFARTAGWWLARRKTLAEEQHYRYVQLAGRRRSVGWYPRACQPPASPDADEPEVLEPARLAALYRDLRKGREDAKDEPGAADFYYGECEMRRRDPDSPRAERLVLWAFWLLSGYALRAWRALTALAVVVVLAGILLAFWGFPSGPPSFRPTAVNPEGALVFQQQPTAPPPGIARLPEGIRFSARSATALLRGPDRPLTPLGEWVEISLRFVGPLLLGLAVLSVRGRVRR
jgi:uncharacterized protein YjbI with pentapeptide repeats